MESSPFDNTLKRCKYIENRLDSRVQRYVMLVQKLNNHAGGHDIEDAGLFTLTVILTFILYILDVISNCILTYSNLSHSPTHSLTYSLTHSPTHSCIRYYFLYTYSFYSGSREERDLGIEIEKDLYEMSECIQSMTDSVSNNGKEYNKESIIKKYQEIQYDYRSEYKRASSSLTYNNPSAYQQLLGNAYYNNNNNKKSDNDALLRERNSITSSMSGIYDVISNASDVKKTLASQV